VITVTADDGDGGNAMTATAPGQVAAVYGSGGILAPINQQRTVHSIRIRTLLQHDTGSPSRSRASAPYSSCFRFADLSYLLPTLGSGLRPVLA
jgi:hypothetical protein